MVNGPNNENVIGCVKNPLNCFYLKLAPAVLHDVNSKVDVNRMAGKLRVGLGYP